MAKKKKEDKEREDDINQDAQGDFNEADDNFGLPDVDYEPIDRDEEEEQSSETSESQEETTEQEEAPAYESEEVYAAEGIDHEAEQTPPKQEYVPGSYTPPKDDSNNGPKVILLILVLIAIGGLIWWFGFESPKREAAEKAKIEKQKQEEIRRRQQAEAAAERKRQEELAAQREAEAAAEAASKPKLGTIETISDRSGRYYVVISSALDGDLAMDYAKQKQKEGIATYIIEPFGKSKFHRIAVSDFGSWEDAQAEANDLKGQYGDGVWVIKY
ncbi:SPOR domain-containing protein [Fulvivirga sp. RKSG066]|uniref:SPOR domain-containing protein n=1 Tax=Fulvivirga aurantia TaxID=2529383 RepID=UPI0012BB977F|nr:SPOR domain-containing protein [Fulvivirga aurantia]MTI20576.1 SPOR domain-containing protein [Fulvivirga aurantia]